MQGLGVAGVLAGEYILESRFDGVVVNGASYKLVKQYLSSACPGFKPDSRTVSISPLYSDAGYLLPYIRGWVRRYDGVRSYRLRGVYRLRVSWAGAGAWAIARRVVECLKDSGSFKVREVRVDNVDIARPVDWFVIRLLTPAQFKLMASRGRGYIVYMPCLARILKPALMMLGRDLHRSVSGYAEITDARVEKVTVYLDEAKPTNWAITGELMFALSSNTPQNVRNTISRALKLIRYTGTGKSRLEGLGQIEVVTGKDL